MNQNLCNLNRNDVDALKDMKEQDLVIRKLQVIFVHAVNLLRIFYLK